MRPLLPVLLAFMAGILSASAPGFSYGYAYALLALSVIPALLLYASGKRFVRLFGALPFFALGALFIIPFTRPELPPNHIKYFIDGPSAAPEAGGLSALGTAIEGVVVSSPEFAYKRSRFYVEAERVLKGVEWTETTGKVHLTVQGAADGFKPGDRVRFISSVYEPWNFGNPGEFDYRGWLAARGVHVKGFVKNSRLITKTGEGGATVSRYIHSARERVKRGIDESGAAYPGILKALIVGDRRGIDPGVEEAFAATGTAHILSISGLHIGIVAVFSYGLFLFLLKRSGRLMLAFNIKKMAAILSLGPVMAYAVISGLATSTQRAVVMTLAFVLTYAFGRGRDYVNTLCLAALFILAAAPYSLREASFQLSFAAVIGIVYLVPRLQRLFERENADGPLEKRRLRGRGGRLAAIGARVFRRQVFTPLLATIAAGLATAPIVAYHFNRASLIGLAANMVVVPLGAIAIPLLLVSAFLTLLWEGAGFVLTDIAGLVVGAMATAVKSFSSLPYSSLWVSTPTLLEMALFYAVVYFSANFSKGRRYIYAAGAIAAVFIADTGYWRYFNARGEELRVTFISVGQGDSAFVEFPGGKTMLIDGGGSYASGFDIGQTVVAPFLWHRKIKRIDYMVLSHAQLDHMGGLRFIARNFSVGEFWWNGKGSLGGLKDSLKGNGTRARIIDAQGRRVEAGGVSVEAFRPYDDPAGIDLNNMSLVVRLRYGVTSFLFPGDIAVEGEAAAVALG
ncbi:MAG: DNA internalization-related competence protein ComEC/Rec2, partial [Deltaproteobacteria bacterium]|nr:DNA internalization-related competence protein ComEC/Rec2 [Deltaproteobacteria bacterium]